MTNFRCFISSLSGPHFAYWSLLTISILILVLWRVLLHLANKYFSTARPASSKVQLQGTLQEPSWLRIIFSLQAFKTKFLDRPVMFSFSGCKLTGSLSYLEFLIVLAFFLLNIAVVLPPSFNHLSETDSLVIMDHLNVGTGSAIILNLPLLFATTGKRNLLSFITGIPYRSLNFFHRAIGRFCFIMSVVHMSLVLEWLRSKNGSSSLMQQFSKQFIQCGLVAITCFCISITMSMLPVRCRKFELFMFTHVCAALVCLPAIYYHKSKTHQWVLATATIWSFDRLARLLGIIYIHFIAPFWCHTNSPRHFGPVNATLDHLDGAIVLSIPMALTWKPGQHIYLSFWSKKMLLKPWLLGRWHPFTLTNTPYDLELQRKYRTEICETSKKCIGCCVIQVRGGTTRWLQKNAGSNISVFIEGPYGGNLNPHAAYSTLVLVAGGAGITYLLGVLEGVALLAQQGKSGSLRRVVIYWMLRKQAHLAWVENRVNEVCAALGTFNLCISAHAYITTRLPVVVPSSRDNFQASATSSKTKASEGEYIKMIHNPISLSLQKPLNSEKYLRSTLVLSDPSKRENKSVFQVLGGRPNLDEILSKICHQSLGRIQIQVCGPKNLSDAVKLAAAKISSPLATWNGKKNTCVAVHYEIFNNT